MMKKLKLKLKYQISYLGVYDYYGGATSQNKFTKWMVENCKGNWNYFSPDVIYNHLLYNKAASKDWPIFYTMIFYFSYKKDLAAFRKRFS